MTTGRLAAAGGLPFAPSDVTNVAFISGQIVQSGFALEWGGTMASS
jgi:hypothetical protein